MTESQMKLHRFMGSKRAKNLTIEHKEVLIKLWSSKITQVGDTYVQQDVDQSPTEASVVYHEKLPTF